MHDLQEAFATAAGEAAWTKDMQALFSTGAFDEAEAQLAQALTALDSEMAWTCLELSRDAVRLSGWEEMADAIDLFEGDPVTGVTIAIANESDRAFEKGQMHRPYVMLGLYTDESYPFSRADPLELLAACQADLPPWAGREEDVEVHLSIDGLDPLNTMLVHHKQRHFFRDSEPQLAPTRYVEFVLACWWRALRWHQAVATACERHGLSRGVPVIAGMVDMRPEAVVIHGDCERREENLEYVGAGHRSEKASAGGFGKGFIQRRPALVTEPQQTGSDIRRRARAEPSEGPSNPERGSLWARIFGRR